MAKIVVLGAGLGGVIAAYEIRKNVRRQDEVIAVNETDFYQFVPSNPWVLVGWRDDIVNRVRHRGQYDQRRGNAVHRVNVCHPMRPGLEGVFAR